MEKRMAQMRLNKSSIARKNIDQLFHQILEKIQFQWKTLKKAFSDLNRSKTGQIDQNELNMYLIHWGLEITEEELDAVFNFFDYNKDGKISYEDFQKTAGSEINPPEFLYFRQEAKKKPQNYSCIVDKCYQFRFGFSDHCFIH